MDISSHVEVHGRIGTLTNLSINGVDVPITPVEIRPDDELLLNGDRIEVVPRLPEPDAVVSS